MAAEKQDRLEGTVQYRADVPGLTAIEIALKLEAVETRQFKVAPETKSPAKRPISLESCWEDTLGHSVCSQRFLHHTLLGCPMEEVGKRGYWRGCGTCSQHSCQAEVQRNLLLGTPLMHGGCRLKKIPCPFDKELPTCNKTHRDIL